MALDPKPTESGFMDTVAAQGELIELDQAIRAKKQSRKAR